MIRSRKVIFTAIATMTPAFFAEVSAKAYSPAPLAAVAIPDDASGVVLGKQLLKQKLLAMTPTEKMRLGGDRIRLAKSSNNAASSGSKQGKPRQMYTASTYCSGMLFA
jgi:hypothetical protein